MDGMEQSAGSAPAQSTPQAGSQQAPAQGVHNQAPESLGWRAGLPKEYQQHEAFTKYGRVGDLARDFLTLQQRGQRPALPGDDSTDEERNAFYKAWGRPETADGYKIEGVEGVKPDHPGIKALMAAAYESGMSQQQFAKIFGHLGQAGSQAIKAQREAKAAAEAQARKALEDADKGLRDEWKEGYDAKRELAMRGFKEYVDDTTRADLEKSGLINQPWFIRLMARAGESIGEGRFIRGGSQAGNPSRGFITNYKTE